MSLRRRHGRFGRACFVAALLVYGIVLLVTPVLHHDLVCHLKSPTHCHACVANPLASRIESGAHLSAIQLAEAGRVEPERAAASVVTPCLSATGRAPPA